MKAEISQKIVELLPELERAAKNIFGNDFEDSLHDVILTTLERDEEFIQGLIEGNYLKYYLIKAMCFKRNRNFEDKKAFQYFSQSVMTGLPPKFDKMQLTYDIDDWNKLESAISQLDFVEQKLIKYYMTEGTTDKLAKKIAETTDGKGIPEQTIRRIIREAKQKLKKIVNEGNGDSTS